MEDLINIVGGTSIVIFSISVAIIFILITIATINETKEEILKRKLLERIVKKKIVRKNKTLCKNDFKNSKMHNILEKMSKER